RLWRLVAPTYHLPPTTSCLPIRNLNRMHALFIAPLLLAGSVLAQSGVARWTLMDLGRLPSQEVTAIVRDDLENTYYATRGGLTVEDHAGGFRVFTRAGTRGELGSDSLTCLGLDRWRDLWAGTDGGGLHALSGGSWRRHTRESTRGGLP